MSVLRVFVLLLALFLAPNVGAQRGGSSVDLFHLDVAQSINMATSGINLSSNGQTVSAAVKNLILILAGQSNCADVIPNAYSPSNPTKIDQLNVYDGAIRVASDPLIGTSYPRSAGAAIYGPGNMYLRVADTYITNGKFDRVILVPLCIGATAVSDWAPGGFLQDTFTVAMRRLSANGIVAGNNITIAAIWNQGEQDTFNSTGQTAYTNSLNSFLSASRTAGFNGIWFINSQSRESGTTSAAVIAAQAAVVNHGSSVWAGLNMDALAGNVCSGSTACRQADDTHLSTNGAITAAANTVTAMGLAGAPF